jgi:hypothetical protein
MAQDVSAEVAGLISEAKVFGSSENIRHGKYKMLIKRIHAQAVEGDKGVHRMAFWEMSPVASESNPQYEGDRVDYVSAQMPGTGPLKDDGTKPNPVNSNCALKVDFDGPGGRSAGSNIKDAILGLFGKNDGEIPNEEINKTWTDLARVKDVKAGEPIGFDATTGQVILADKNKMANPACGMYIYCTTLTKKKKTPNDKGAYITKLVWSCVSPPGMGENAPELVAKRRAEIEASRPDDDEAETPAAPNPYGQQVAAPAQQQQPVPLAATPPAPPAAPSAPSVPSTAFTPPAPWRLHPNAAPGTTPDTRWYWDGGNGVLNETQLMQRRNGAA